jgi:hypothetical protein
MRCANRPTCARTRCGTRTSVAIGLLACALAVACGGPAASTTKSASASPGSAAPIPAAAIARAIAELNSGPFRFTTAWAIAGGVTKLTGAYESTYRVAGILSNDRGPAVHVTLFDGRGYVSTDGTQYLNAPFYPEFLHPMLAERLNGIAGNLGEVRDSGTTPNSSGALERFTAPVNLDYLTGWNFDNNNVLWTLESSAGDMDPPQWDPKVHAVRYTAGTVTFDIDRASGHLMAMKFSGMATVDLALAAAAYHSVGSGVKVETDDWTMTFTNHGARVQISRPAASGAIGFGHFQILEDGGPPLP